jgi:hypothetical protein
VLLLRQIGEGPPPIAEEQLWNDLAGKHVFADGKFALLRTPKSIATFSWGRQVMGMVLPLRKDLLLTPNERSLIGNIEVEGKPDSPKVREVHLGDEKDSFTIAGIVDRGGGAIEQRFAFAALPSGMTIYADSVERKRDVKITAMHLGTLGICNEPTWVYHDGKRKLDFDGGERTFTADSTEDFIGSHSASYRLDGLRFFCLNTGMQVYHAKPSITRGRVEQLFQLNTLPPDTKTATDVIVFNPKEMPRLSGGQDLHFTILLDDSRRIAIDLDQLKISLHE